MVSAQIGDTVLVHYKGTLEDGSIFDTSENQDPLQFTLGDGSVIPGFESAVIGMNVGDKKTFTVAPEDGYGEPEDELFMEIDREDLPSEIVPEVGMVLEVSDQDGMSLPIVVVEVGKETVLLDGNHPLAGQNLIFEIELVEIA